MAPFRSLAENMSERHESYSTCILHAISGTTKSFQ